ncbi:uncharacterized protein LOC134829976 [Culicoides brevitarsis]|uniref:uncharacterized protein LOC134829976 n=1 Tax=Culicoides brevitarsis TaxID=469753 RepID=UPI00307C529A
MKHLSKIIRDITFRCSCAAKTPFTEDLSQRILGLTPFEKSLIADFVYTLEYDIGTGRILSLLSRISLISIHQYVSRIEDSALLLNIYNDFLETQPSLFAELVEGARSSVHLKAALDDFLEDFLSNLEGLTSNPFKEVFGLVTEDTQKLLIETIFGNLMKNGDISIEDAVSNQHLWTKQDPIKDLIIKDCLLIGEAEAHLMFLHRYALAKSKSEVNWRGYCSILGIFSRIYGSKCLSMSRKTLSDDFKKFVKDRNDFLLHFILVTVRQMCLSAPNDVKYGDWYKQNIGEMMYIMDKEEFLYVMKVLTKLIELETNKEFIKTHINTRIQAPPLCNDTVLAFKAILRSRLETLEGKNQQEVIEIDLSPNE